MQDELTVEDIKTQTAPTTPQMATRSDNLEKTAQDMVHVEEKVSHEPNLVYNGEEEPEIHMRTWIAIGAMFLLNMVQVFALQGPPAVVGHYLRSQ